jgi:hypothetical protein
MGKASIIINKKVLEELSWKQCHADYRQPEKRSQPPIFLKEQGIPGQGIIWD